MLVKGCQVVINMPLADLIPIWIKDILQISDVQKTIRISPNSLEFVPRRFKTQEMCEKAVERRPHALEYVPEKCKTREICKKPLKDVYVH